MIMEEMDLYPSYIDHTNFKYLTIDDYEVRSIILQDFPNICGFLEILESIPKDATYDFALYIKKQDSMKLVKELTYSISSSSGEIKTSSSNQLDIEVMDKVKNDAKALRKDIQINGEEIFFVNAVLTFYSLEQGMLQEVVRKFQSKLYAKGIVAHMANFRQLDAYVCTLPLNRKNETILLLSQRNMTTSAVTNLFPFYKKTIFDKEGVLFGFTMEENKLCNIDMFAPNYLNANMCIFGSSGSGKSYFIKLMILRQYVKGNTQYVFDIEDEYAKVAKELSCFYFNIADKHPSDYWNPFEITAKELKRYKGQVVIEKINKVKKGIAALLSIEDNKELFALEQAIVSCYQKRGIVTKDDIIQREQNGNIYLQDKVISSQSFPLMEELAKEVKNKQLKEKLIHNLILKYPSFCQYTNIEGEDSLKIISTSGLNEYELAFFTSYILEEIKEGLVCQQENQHTLIYMDEIWKYIATNTKFELAKIIFECFKTIRKKKASMVAVTQDISDFFLYENGNYGKSMLNNTGFKLFFKMEFTDHSILNKLNIFSQEQLENMAKLEKGQTVLSFHSHMMRLKVKASSYEREIIEEE